MDKAIKKDDRIERFLQEAGVDYTLPDTFDVSRIYTQVNVSDVSLIAKGWTGDTLSELKRNMETKNLDRIFGIHYEEEHPFMMDKDSNYKALFYAYENL